MGKFLPVLTAFLQYTFGVYIFRKPDLDGSGPLFSCLIVLFSILLLLLDLRLYPQSLRRLWGCGNYVVQYYIAVFLTEHIMADFWFPLEVSVLTILPKIAEGVEQAAEYTKVCGKPEVVINVLTAGGTGVFCSYMLSLFIFFTVLHATRKIDLRMLEYGVGCFITSITATLEEKMKSFAVCDDKNVVNNKRSTSRKRGGTGNLNVVEETSDDFDFEDYDSPQYIK